MTYLRASILRGDQTTALYIFSRRFWRWIVTAVAVIVLSLIGHPMFVHRLPLWACYSVVTCTLFAHVFTRLNRIAATFAFRIHTHAFEYAKAIADGETASIFLRQSNSGFQYFDLSLTRNWRSRTTNKVSSENSFFCENEGEIVQAVKEAAAWIRNKRDDAGGTEPEDQTIERQID